MSVKARKDSWTTEEDNLLKDIILKRTEQGLTQISGFQEASVLLGRSKQACAFRWNKNLRPLLINKETTSKEIRSKEAISKDTPIENHMQLALDSYSDMKESYTQISQDYNLLKRDYEQLVNWVKQGIKHIE